MQDPTPVTTAGGVAAEILVPLLATLIAAVVAAVRGWLKARATRAWAATLLGAIDTAKLSAQATPALADGVRAVTTTIGRAIDWSAPGVQRTHAAELKAAGANATSILGAIRAAGSGPR